MCRKFVVGGSKGLACKQFSSSVCKQDVRDLCFPWGCALFEIFMFKCWALSLWEKSMVLVCASHIGLDSFWELNLSI